MTRAKQKTDALIVQAGPMRDYQVHCCHCGEDFAVSIHPDYCISCGVKFDHILKRNP